MGKNNRFLNGLLVLAGVFTFLLAHPNPCFSADESPAAVDADVVSIDFNKEGVLVALTPEGKEFQIKEGLSTIDFGNGIVVDFNFNAEEISLYVRNHCDSTGVFKFRFFGTYYTLGLCEDKTVRLSTAENEIEIPDTQENTFNSENPDEGREPMSPTGA